MSYGIRLITKMVHGYTSYTRVYPPKHHWVYCERSFSKLKIIKTRLRSSLSQQNLNDLLLISIENDLIPKVRYIFLLQHVLFLKLPIKL
ncbi:zinc finger MYM-type protein 1-like [Aphis craccivora]|uniref:Zinc finger MYM-type protein 1-like n=1 Tax=Aphis craccivora TaxID=307492 RepID=A0A6G0W4U9_APHCR|nr:zinc finger MYM-type protein 1-like [Aphis craccivora]